VCAFANSGGGDIIIGVAEERNSGLPTGYPDPNAPLGVSVPNCEHLLLSYESQVLDCIDERLLIGLRAIPFDDRQIIILRIPNSLGKPHRVFYEGKTYFQARRERQRKELNVREIKELVMKTASQSERAEAIVVAEIEHVEVPEKAPVLVAALLPIFATNFSVDLQDRRIIDLFACLNVRGYDPYRANVRYNLAGLWKEPVRNSSLSLSHRGLLTLQAALPSNFNEMAGAVSFRPVVIDRMIQRLVNGARALYAVTGLGAPALLGISLSSRLNYLPQYSEWEDFDVYKAHNHRFPILTLSELGPGSEPLIKPLYDHIHQVFGQPGSPSFDQEGQWIQQKIES
jgi:hypothetical protein